LQALPFMFAQFNTVVFLAHGLSPFFRR